MADLLKLEDFTELKPGELTMDVGGQAIPMDVVAHRRLPPVPTREDPFEVELQGPIASAVGQGTYTFTHPRLGQIEIFIVPGSRTATHIVYVATFN